MAKNSPSISEKMDRLVEAIGQKDGSLDDVYQNRGSNAVSFFEEDSSPAISGNQLKSMGKRGRNLARLNDLVRGGYEPQFRSLGGFLRGVAGQDDSFAGNYQKATSSLKKAVGVNTFDGESAGSLVLPEFAPSLMEREFDNDLWSRTDNYTVSGNSMTFPKVKDENRTDGNRGGGVTASWIGEAKTMEDSKPSVTDFTLRLKKLSVVVFVTQEMIEDSSYTLEQWVSRVVKREISFALGNATVRGSGVKQPLGYMNAPCKIAVAKESGQGANTVLAENILNMWKRRVAGEDTNYTWFMNQDVEAQLAQMTLGTGNLGGLVYMPAGGLSDKGYSTLMGRPIQTTEFNSTLGTEGDIALADYNRYISIGKGGITEEVSPHVQFLSDQIAYKFTIRVDGRPCDDEAITPYQGTNTQSPFITLATRA